MKSTLQISRKAELNLAFSLTLAFCSHFAAAQKLSLSFSSGQVVRRSQNLGNSQNIGTGALRLAYARPTEAPAYGNPYLGFSLHYQNYASAGIGHSLSVFAFAERSFSLGNSGLSFESYLGIGPVYVQEVFHIKRNYSSQTVSSHLNLGGELGLALAYAFSPEWQARLGANFFHASNLGMVKPNYGLNVPGFMLGLSWQNKNRQDPLSIPSPENRKKAEWLLYYQAAIRQIAYNDPAHYVHNINLEYSRKISALLNVNAGFSLFQDAIGTELEKYAPALYSTPKYSPFGTDHLTGGPYLGLELFLGKLSAFGQVGYYVFHPHRRALAEPNITPALRNYIHYYNEYFIFNRLGLRYRLGPHWLFSLSGKTQLFKVQYFEMGLGWRF